VEDGDVSGFPLFSTPKSIMTRTEGGTHIIRKSDGVMYESHKTYWSTTKFSAGSKVNGQVVMGVTEFYDTDGSFQYLEAYV
jgi:hypothetical protein